MSEPKQLAGGERTDAPSGWAIEKTMSAWQQARDRLLAADPSLADDEVALFEALGPEEHDRQEMLARLLRATLHARDMAAAADERAKAITARRDRYRRRAEATITDAFAIMKETGERRFELPELTASIRRNPESVFPISEDDIPEAFWRVVTTRSLDKELIRKTIKAGEAVPGATLAEGIESLMIKAS